MIEGQKNNFLFFRPPGVMLPGGTRRGSGSLRLLPQPIARRKEKTLISAKEQMQWQERLSNSAHQREVADLQAAGLNPVLSAGGSGASTPTGSVDSISSSTSGSSGKSVKQKAPDPKKDDPAVVAADVVGEQINKALRTSAKAYRVQENQQEMIRKAAEETLATQNLQNLVDENGQNVYFKDRNGKWQRNTYADLDYNTYKTVSTVLAAAGLGAAGGMFAPAAAGGKAVAAAASKNALARKISAALLGANLFTGKNSPMYKVARKAYQNLSSAKQTDSYRAQQEAIADLWLTGF